MAVTVVKHRPELTSADVQELFQGRFGSQYRLTQTVGIPNTDFVVQHSGWSGLSVKLRQRENETAILTKAVIPSIGARILVGGFIGIVPYFLFGGYANGRKLEKEALEFIQTAPQFS